MHELTPGFLITGMFLIGFGCQWLAWRIKLPAILFLLLAGISLGPVTGVLDPDALLGDLLFPIVSLSVAIILFEGSLTLHFYEIRDLNSIVRRLVSGGAVITWVLIAAASKVLFQLEWSIAFLLGSLLVVTGPTVIVPMLRTVRPTARIGNILRWEGIVIDPIGALLAVVAYEYIISSQSGGAFGNSLHVFVRILVVGTLLGLITGHLLGFLLKKHWLPEFLQNFGTIALVLGSFTLSNALEHESGLLAVTVMGIYLANTPNIHVEHILSFKENLTVLLISALFILLAARLDFGQVRDVAIPAAILLLLMQFLIRPFMVWICAIGTDLNWREKALISWIGPRGIVAAAISGLFALQLEQQGSADIGETLVAVTFFIIIGTVVLQSATAGLVAGWLGLVEPAPRGALIIGANPLARAIGEALQKNDFTVLLADPSWENIREARLMGLPTFYGNAISEQADRNLDLVGIGRLIAASPRREDNVLASMRYRYEFGRENIFAVQTKTEASLSGKATAIATTYKGAFIGSEELTFSQASQWLKQGARISTTQMSEEYSFDDFVANNASAVLPLFAIDKKRKLHVFTEEEPLKPKAGWHIVSLYKDKPDKDGESDNDNKDKEPKKKDAK